MSYSCRIERYSRGPRGQGLLSYVVQYPRVALAEFVTHRRNSDSWGDYDFTLCDRTTTKDISKNSASSRAIPFQRMLERIEEDPYIPTWTLNQKGMQGEKLSDVVKMDHATKVWLEASGYMIAKAKELSDLGVHKQDCNRLLEPWMWVTQIITATESQLNNFFALRCHKAAFPPFRKIARMMFLAKKAATAVNLNYGQWHLPFVPLEQQLGLTFLVDQYEVSVNKFRPLPDLVKHSAARCAWLSYENHDKDGTEEAMLRTFNTLMKEIPVHGSPCEHQATPMHPTFDKEDKLRSNLKNWIQARKLIQHENITEYDPSDDEIASWDDVSF
jgi:hypothetical protein